MTPDELRAVIADLGLSQVGFARAVDYTPQHVRKWVNGKAVIPRRVELLAALLRLPGAQRVLQDFTP